MSSKFVLTPLSYSHLYIFRLLLNLPPFQNQVEAEPIVLEYNLDGKPFVLTFNVKMEFSQLDGKCLASCSGLGGAACTMCKHTTKEIASMGITEVPI